MSTSREQTQARPERARPEARSHMAALPPELMQRLGETAGDVTPPQSPDAVRAGLAQLGLCDASMPAVTLELYGGLRLRTGCRALPLHAGTVSEALDVLRAVFPKAARLLPAEGGGDGHYRYSLNGRDVTADVNRALQAGDHLIVFSASVGG